MRVFSAAEEEIINQHYPQGSISKELTPIAIRIEAGKTIKQSEINALSRIARIVLESRDDWKKIQSTQIDNDAEPVETVREELIDRVAAPWGTLTQSPFRHRFTFEARVPSSKSGSRPKEWPSIPVNPPVHPDASSNPTLTELRASAFADSHPDAINAMSLFFEPEDSAVLFYAPLKKGDVFNNLGLLVANSDSELSPELLGKRIIWATDASSANKSLETFGEKIRLVMATDQSFLKSMDRSHDSLTIHVNDRGSSYTGVFAGVAIRKSLDGAFLPKVGWSKLPLVLENYRRQKEAGQVVTDRSPVTEGLWTFD